MVKKILLLLLLVPVCYGSYYDEIYDLAEQLEVKNEYDTVDNVHYWVMANINHKPYFYQRYLKRTWEEWEGDCTDKALLATTMLRKLGYDTRRVYGFTEVGLHDWYVVKMSNGEWYNPDDMYFEWHKKIGYGRW